MLNEAMPSLQPPLGGAKGAADASTDFNLWLQMATDNKINAKNSWNFALIDYFHDLSLLREGDGAINFQKASATLDGCVKIYSSRVDSAVSETGNLLSGLSTLAAQQALPEPEASDSDNDPDYGVRAKPRKKVPLAPPPASSTLVGMGALRRTKRSCELEVDPMFRKALADFDEGGAKSLLLNMLGVDRAGRVMFDGAMGGAAAPPIPVVAPAPDRQIDVAALGHRFIPNGLAGLVLCPSMREIHEISQRLAGGNEVSQAGGEGGIFYDDDEGEYLAANLTVHFEADYSHILPEGMVEVVSDVPDYDLLAYFDHTIPTPWQRREHWKIANLKARQREPHTPAAAPAPRAKHTVDFFSHEVDEDELFAESSTNIDLPRHQWSRDKHLLPRDMRFTSQRLIRLFTKPSAVLPTFNKRRHVPHAHVEPPPIAGADEEYWAQQYRERERMSEIAREDLQELHQSYDQLFFQDDGDDAAVADPIGADFDTLGAPWRGNASRHINFSRVANRIDVRQLKDSLWHGLTDKTAAFSLLVQGVAPKYPEASLTSFCFICILHLANEHGLELSGTANCADLTINLPGT